MLSSLVFAVAILSAPSPSRDDTVSASTTLEEPAVPLFGIEFGRPLVYGPNHGTASLPCGRFFAPLRLTETAPAAADGISGSDGADCPFDMTLSSDRELIVEGLDRSGGRLFTTISADPRWSVQESIGQDGELGMESIGRSQVDSTYVTFTAPIDPGLVRLRIWQVDSDNVATPIGEIPWVNVELNP
ncbi:MAG: hypothetical protein ACOH1E_10940 [Brevundimonas sp.]